MPLCINFLVWKFSYYLFFCCKFRFNFNFIFIEKLLKEWNKQPPSSSKAPISSQMIKEHGLHRHYGSKYRPEALSHFPFVDEGGTVYDIFHNNCGRPNLLTMGEAGRNRLILKVFEAMRLDSHGIRLSDLPEALQVRHSFQLSKLILNCISLR